MFKQHRPAMTGHVVAYFSVWLIACAAYFKLIG